MNTDSLNLKILANSTERKGSETLESTDPTQSFPQHYEFQVLTTAVSDRR